MGSLRKLSDSPYYNPIQEYSCYRLTLRTCCTPNVKGFPCVFLVFVWTRFHLNIMVQHPQTLTSLSQSAAIPRLLLPSRPPFQRDAARPKCGSWHTGRSQYTPWLPAWSGPAQSPAGGSPTLPRSRSVAEGRGATENLGRSGRCCCLSLGRSGRVSSVERAVHWSVGGDTVTHKRRTTKALHGLDLGLHLICKPCKSHVWRSFLTNRHFFSIPRCFSFTQKLPHHPMCISVTMRCKIS